MRDSTAQKHRPTWIAWLVASTLITSSLVPSAGAQGLPSGPALASPADSAPSLPAGLPPSLPPASAIPPAAGIRSAPGTNRPAESTRYIEENGIRYRVTRAVVRQPVQELRYEDRQQTYYQERYRTDVQPVNYYAQVPVTQYECVPRLYDWWRVFQGGYVAYGMEPYTTFVTQPQSTYVPVTRREVLPVTQTVKVPVPQLRFVEREQVSRVPVGPANSSVATTPRPPTYIPPNIPPTGIRPTYVPPGIAAPRYVPPTNYANQANGPYDPNPFGGWGVATGNRPSLYSTPAYVPPSSGGYGGSGLIPPPRPNYIPPIATPSPTAGRALPDERYGGVARFDGGLPRYGTSPDARR